MLPLRRHGHGAPAQSEEREAHLYALSGNRIAFAARQGRHGRSRVENLDARGERIYRDETTERNSLAPVAKWQTRPGIDPVLADKPLEDG